MKNDATRIWALAICYLFSLGLAAANPLDTWVTRTSGTTENLGDSLHANGLFVIVGRGGTILTSTNGVTWSARDSQTPNRFLNVAFGGGIYVAAGGTSEEVLDTTVVTSSNGVDWTLQSVPQVGRTRCLTYGAGKFVGWCYTEFSGSPVCTVITSSNGLTWTRHVSITNHFLAGITYANGLYVAVGQDYTGGPANGAIFSSTDGISWTKRTGSFANELSDVAYGNGVFLAVGWYGDVQTSGNGIDWTTQTPLVPGDFFNAIFANGTFVALGDETESGESFLAFSANGIDWMTRKFSTNTVRTVSYGNSSYVIAGFYGFIAQSGSFTAPILTALDYSAENGFQINLKGEVGRIYQLEASTNLLMPNWSVVKSVTLGQNETNFFDGTATNFARRFYRAVSP